MGKITISIGIHFGDSVFSTSSEKMILFNYFRYANWMDAGYYKAIVTIDGAYDFEVIFLVSVRGEISCEYLWQNWSKSVYCAFFGYNGNYCPFYVECCLLSYDRTWLHSLLYCFHFILLSFSADNVNMPTRILALDREAFWIH